MKVERITIGYSTDADHAWKNLEDHARSDIDWVFEIFVKGHEDSTPSEFRCRLTTPEALVAQKRNRDPFFGQACENLVASRATMVLGSSATWHAARQHIIDIVTSNAASSVREAAADLERHFVDEYSDYDGGSARCDESGKAFLSLTEVRHVDGTSLRGTWPGRDQDVDYLLQLVARHRDDELQPFRVRLVSPEALLESCSVQPVLCHHAAVIMRWTDWRDVLETLQTIVGSCGAPRKDDATWRLRRYFSDIPP